MPDSSAGATILSELSPLDLARATRMPVETATRWTEGAEHPTGQALERLQALARVVDLLDEAGLRDPTARSEWLRHPNRMFAGESPLDLVSSGDDRRVLDYVQTLL